jgi:hypothetical protein
MGVVTLGDNKFTDEEMTQHKKETIEKRVHKKDIQEVVNGIKRPGDCTDDERIARVERDSYNTGLFVDELAEDALQMSRRILRIGRQITNLEAEYNDALCQLKDIKEKAAKLKKDEEDFDVRREHKSDTKRETILSILAITIPAIAVVVGILIAIKVI